MKIVVQMSFALPAITNNYYNEHAAAGTDQSRAILLNYSDNNNGHKLCCTVLCVDSVPVDMP